MLKIQGGGNKKRKRYSNWLDGAREHRSRHSMSSQTLDLSLALPPEAQQHQTSYLYTRVLLRPSLTKYWSSILEFLRVTPKHLTRPPIISTGNLTALVTSLDVFYVRLYGWSTSRNGFR